ncbi:MAG: hypothetical protein H6529_12825 [Nocardioides sp.]|nr:hypothetical protein [Nocardioides sp.]
MAADDRTFAGTVAGVDAVETVTNASSVRQCGTSTAEGRQARSDRNIVATTGSRDDVNAPQRRPRQIGGQTTATVQADDGTTRTAPVEVGLEGDSQTQIISGLEPGDVLVIPQQSGGSGGFTFPGAGGLGGIGGAP